MEPALLMKPLKKPIRFGVLALLACTWSPARAATSVDEHRAANPQRSGFRCLYSFRNSSHGFSFIADSAAPQEIDTPVVGDPKQPRSYRRIALFALQGGQRAFERRLKRILCI